MIKKTIHRTTSTSESKICISQSIGGVANTTLTNWSLSYSKLLYALSNPTVGKKDGSYFVRGPVSKVGTRASNNIAEASIVVLDGDSSIDPDTGEIIEGAPLPKKVHIALCDLEINHILYTSYSHGIKGNRYRVIIFLDRHMLNSKELKSCVDWVVQKLYAAGIYINSVKENYTWAQPWYFPRIRSEDASFMCLKHNSGNALDVENCLEWAKNNTVVARKAAVKSCAPTLPTGVNTSNSPISGYNAKYGNVKEMLKLLALHGYQVMGQTPLNNEIAYRLLPPKSSSKNPGVILFKSTKGDYRVCSHHNGTSDLLATAGPDGNSLAHDAFDLFRILEHKGDYKEAIKAIIPKKEVIEITSGSLKDNVTQAINLIAVIEPPIIFQRGPSLVRIAHFQQGMSVEGCEIPIGTAVIIPLNATDLTIRLHSVATWKRASHKGDEVVLTEVNPPSNVANGILSVQGDWGDIPPLKGISEVPILRKDGSLHDSVGYDPNSNLYYEGECPPLAVPNKPTREDAKNAAKVLLKVFSEFPFVDRGLGYAVILAYIFTMILRGQISLAPLFAVTATTPGTGKGLLLEIANLIVRARDAAIMPPVSSDEEMRKRITALLMQGVTSVNMDNWATPVGGEAINAFLTARVWTDRVLGASKTVMLPNQVTWSATGNNLTVRGDMVRRTLLIELDAGVERPELRKFKVQNIAHYVFQHRSELLTAAFTVLRAYQVAGCPEVNGTPLGRFEEWWSAVCAPIIWVGLPDPVKSQDQLRQDDPEIAKLSRLLNAWYGVYGNDAASVPDAINVAMEAKANSPEDDLKEALMECASERGFINSKMLGWYLKKFAGRIVKSLQLQRGNSGTKPKYRVKKQK